MELAASLLLVCAVTFLILIFTRSRKPSNLPPGPTPLPLIGNVLQLNFKDFVKYFVKIGTKYGPVSMVYLGPRPVVILNGHDVVREAFLDNGEIYSDRGRLAFAEMLFNGYGLLFSNGERWKQMRRFSLSTLRNFGMGKRSLEERVQEEAKCLGEEFQKKKGELFDPTYLLSLAVSNVICSIVFGDRFDYEDKDFLAMLALLKETFQILTSPWGQIFNLAPNFFKPFPGSHHKLIRNFNTLREYVMEKVKIHEETLDENCPRDYIDCFIIKMKEEKDNPNSEFIYENLCVNLIQLFFAGTETTSTTLRYAILILLKHPEIQNQIRDEIDTVIGKARNPSVGDRLTMPYLDAVIHEIQRFADIIPLGLPHATSKDTSLRGYTIPKGTTVFPMLTTVLKDEKYFPDAQKFDPGHFLDGNGSVKKNDAFMPFSIGKRICVGEGLARMEIFLFLSYILQKFNLECNIKAEDIDISPIPFRLNFAPRPYELSVNLR
ncbi:cytochrome P450 2C23-like [Pelobates fuscus]|uniref:cytochrome P450 2C23-like n=1 Tax=Pelobates fuscus TaxID=191477 RepID=UPI002FE4BD62